MTLNKTVFSIIFASIVAASGVSFASEQGYQTAATQLQQRLGKVLMTTIKEQGHIAAIDVCNEQAPEIASAVSEELSLSVGRTALKVRNPDNKPNNAQQDVLKEFEERWQQSKASVPTETYVNDDGHTVWMKAIVMQPQCAACHGNSIEPELKQAISERYPNDKATGFDVGDIRGAFVVTSK
ncbi:MAG: Tll0287-like domain-containing protein [Pseudomonadota bacterium]